MPSPRQASRLSSIEIEAVTVKTLYLPRNRRMQCSYTNNSQQFQIVRMATADGDCLERTLFPGGRIYFEARPQDRLEIHTGNAIAAILSDRIPCYQLAYRESIAS